MTDTQGRRSSHAPSSQQQTPPARQRNAQGKNLALSKLVISTALSLRHDKQQGVEDALVQRFSKHCIELIASVTGGKKYPFFRPKQPGLDLPAWEQEGLNTRFSSNVLQKHLKRLLHERNGGGLFFFFLLRVVKTKNSHILSLPFRGLLGLACSSALICRWAARFPAGDTGGRPRDTAEMSRQGLPPLLGRAGSQLCALASK